VGQQRPATHRGGGIDQLGQAQPAQVVRDQQQRTDLTPGPDRRRVQPRERTSPTVQLPGGFELIEPAQRCHNTLPNFSVDPMPFHQLHVFVQLVASPDSLDSWIHEWHNDSA